MANKNNSNRNTILVVDDHSEKLAFYWRLFDEDAGARFDVLGESQPRRRRLLCHRLQNSFQFVEMFESMHRTGDRFPLCIVDLKMPGPDGLLDKLRGLAVSTQIRAIDPLIHIVVATSDPDIDGGEVTRRVGGSTHFFRTPFSPAQQEEFLTKVYALLGEWNANR
jgi:CheY-like chemotaxis protein